MPNIKAIPMISETGCSFIAIEKDGEIVDLCGYQYKDAEFADDYLFIKEYGVMPDFFDGHWMNPNIIEHLKEMDADDLRKALKIDISYDTAANYFVAYDFMIATACKNGHRYRLEARREYPDIEEIENLYAENHPGYNPETDWDHELIDQWYSSSNFCYDLAEQYEKELFEDIKDQARGLGIDPNRLVY